MTCVRLPVPWRSSDAAIWYTAAGSQSKAEKQLQERRERHETISAEEGVGMVPVCLFQRCSFNSRDKWRTAGPRDPRSTYPQS